MVFLIHRIKHDNAKDRLCFTLRNEDLFCNQADVESADPLFFWVPSAQIDRRGRDRPLAPRYIFIEEERARQLAHRSGQNARR